jgi:GGDEF domain-containing protein
MEALAVHSVSRDEKSHAVFREAVRALRRNSEAATSADEILAFTAAVIQLHEANGRDMEDFIRVQTKERQEIVQMLSETLIAVTQEGAYSGANLGQIARDLESASQVDDLRVLKGRLQESLRSIVKESARQKDIAGVVASRLRERLQNAQGGPQALDPITGLPGVAAAQLYLDLAIQSSSPIYAVVLCVERLEAINARFGYSLGDRLLLKFAQHVAQRLAGEDKLFRWRGPTLIAALERNSSLHDVNIEVARLVPAKHEELIEWGGHSVLLSVSARFLVVALKDFPAIDDLIATVNSFAAPSIA